MFNNLRPEPDCYMDHFIVSVLLASCRGILLWTLKGVVELAVAEIAELLGVVEVSGSAVSPQPSQHVHLKNIGFMQTLIIFEGICKCSFDFPHHFVRFGLLSSQLTL